jgi:hypothetical protein
MPLEASSVTGESSVAFYSQKSHPGLIDSDRGLELSFRSESLSNSGLSLSSKRDDMDYEVPYDNRAELQGNQSDCIRKLLQGKCVHSSKPSWY